MVRAGSYDGTFVQDYEYVAGLGDLDQANGRTGTTPEYPEDTYYYVITPNFPFIPRYWRDEPSRDFVRRGGGGGGGPGRPQGPSGGGGRGGQSTSALQALNDSDTIKELGLTSKASTDLKSAIQKLQRSLQINQGRNENISADKRRAQRQTRLAEMSAAVKSLREAQLTPAQNNQLQQIINHAAGTESLLTEEARIELVLSDGQFGTLYSLVVQARSPHALSFEWEDVVTYLEPAQVELLEKRIGDTKP